LRSEKGSPFSKSIIVTVLTAGGERQEDDDRGIVNEQNIYVLPHTRREVI